jgi:photosystem II stability/assembly factor-like uncharacterized protein
VARVVVAVALGLGSLASATVALSDPAQATPARATSAQAIPAQAASAQAIPTQGAAAGARYTQAAPGGHGRGPSWRLLPTGSDSHFRGLAPVSRDVAWISGYDGVVLRTVDGGRSWIDASPTDAATLEFRDISAFDTNHAVAMSAGSGPESRLYSTDDGGRSWTLAYQNTAPTAFFDCMSFSDSRHGLALSDPVDGKFRILSTLDGGRTWSVRSNARMPVALTGEAGFAAGGECLTTSGRHAWFGTGAGRTARIFHSRDRGVSWQVSDSPLTSSPSAGVFALAFRTPLLGIAVGGDFEAPGGSSQVSAVSYANGPWKTARTEPSGYRSGVSFVPRTPATAIAVGLTGSDLSYDGGRHWRTFDTGQFDTVSCAEDGSCWASGDLGRVAVLHR